MTSKSTIYQKILELQKEVVYVKKDSRNAFHKYTYVSESNLIEKVMEKFSAKGLIILPSMVEGNYIDAKGKDGESKPGYEVLYEYTIVDVDSKEEIKMRAGGFEQGDKCAFKAMTGANKYFWLRFLQIATGDDPEHEEPPVVTTQKKDEYVQGENGLERSDATKVAIDERIKAIRGLREFLKLTAPEAVRIMGGTPTKSSPLEDLEEMYFKLEKFGKDREAGTLPDKQAALLTA